MVSNYAIGMGLSFLTLIVGPAAAILNQRTNSTSVLQRSDILLSKIDLDLAN